MVLKTDEEGPWLSFQVRVQPRSPRTRIVGWRADSLKIRLAASADKGRANRALVRFLADVLQVRPRRIRLLTGVRSKNKTVGVSKLSKTQFQRRITPYIV